MILNVNEVCKLTFISLGFVDALKIEVKILLSIPDVSVPETVVTGLI